MPDRPEQVHETTKLRTPSLPDGMFEAPQPSEITMPSIREITLYATGSVLLFPPDDFPERRLEILREEPNPNPRYDDRSHSPTMERVRPILTMVNLRSEGK
jgi:hypothetical protein